MATAKGDFERFVMWLYQPTTQAPQDARRLANLVLANFDELVQTVRQRSQRSISLVALARRDLAQTPDGPPDIQSLSLDGAWPWQRLQDLTIGPFRGFRTPEYFDLRKRVILIYGPNGSGKTSFFEGLEYCLLGAVEEAENIRIDRRAYLSNIHAQRFEPPTLRAIDHRNQEVATDSNSEIFRFCFIEKNRIDAFSRIAARSPAQRTELIATLFGMDKFNEFVSHFNESIDQQLVLTAVKQLELTGKQTTLAADQTIVSSELEALQNLEREETALARTHSAEITYPGLKVLIGTADAPGRLQHLESIVNAVPPPIIGLSREGLLSAFEASRMTKLELTNLADRLEAHSSQVSFKALYDAVLALQAIEGDHCPACDTPLVDTNSNPFYKATAGLLQLKELGELQEEYRTKQAEAVTASRELRRQLADLAGFVAINGEQESPVGRYLTNLPSEPSGDWWTEVYSTQVPKDGGAGDAEVTIEHILEICDRVAAQDTASLMALQQRQRHITERDELNVFQLSVQAQDLKRQQVVDSVAAAKARIEAFDVANAELIREVAKEARDIERDAPIKIAYDRFLALLRNYRDQLPGTLMAGLNDSAMNFFNEINREDLESDKLAALHLPLTSEQRIEISFRGNPRVRVDALSVLSEGHIRCLGLAILLAKGQSIQSPLIVFDDVVNAIDHDHRRGIRETIFESDYFLHTQLIVTCHSDEFIKDIQQHLQFQLREDCRVYLFLNHMGDYQPRVKGNLPSRNYVVKARASIGTLDSRGALAFCRQGLEVMSEKVWRWLGSHGLGVLSLQLTGPGAELGLRNLCEALRKRLVDAVTFNHANKSVLMDAFDRILGIPAANLVWIYLNKGTHEEANRDDFDVCLVEVVVQTLETLYALDLRVDR